MSATTRLHPTALVASGARVGEGTRIWAFCNVLDGAVIGRRCQICDRVFVEGGCTIGDEVTVKCGVSLWTGIHLEHGVFVGPGVMFTNDPAPRSGRHLERHPETHVERWASLGAGAILLPGVRIGEYAMVGAGAVVAADVAPHALVLGSPARLAGWVCACGARVPREVRAKWECTDCGHVMIESTDAVWRPVSGSPTRPPERRG